MSIAVGYIRVSTEEQQREGISLDMQVEKVRLYCQMKNLELVGIYGDPGISGKRMDTRPGVQAVMHMVRTKRIDHVVIYKLDRLARNTIETLLAVDDLEKAGAALHSISENLDTKSAIGRFVVRIMAALAEMERDQISERVRAALEHKRSNGGRVSRHAPLGYEFDGDSVVENYDEQDAMEIARDLAGAGFSLRKVARVLKSQGYLNRNGRAFSASAVKAMLKTAEACIAINPGRRGTSISLP